MGSFRHSSLVWIIVAITAGGCKRETLPMLPKPVTKTEMVCYSSWRMAAQGYDRNDDGIIDIDETPAFACFLDNRTYFFEDGHGSFDQGPTKCNANQNQSRRFEWKFTDNETMIFVDGQHYKIVTLNETEFTISFEDIYSPPPNMYVMKFVH